MPNEYYMYNVLKNGYFNIKFMTFGEFVVNQM